jgi:hypothetical protein
MYLGRLRKSMKNLRLDVFYLAGIHTVGFPNVTEA